MADIIGDYYINRLTKRMNALDIQLEDLLKEIDLLILLVTNPKGYTKYLEPGSYNFQVPYGVTKIYVTAIGGGGAGGSGGTAQLNYQNYEMNGGGGGGGGRGTYIIDQEINVTQGEFLSITVGDGGTVTESTITPGYYTSNSGKDTLLKRGTTTLLTAAKGTAGGRGNSTISGSNNGGSGGTIGGGTGGKTTSSSIGTGGTGGSASSAGFQNYGSGGTGGQGIKYTSGTTYGGPGTAGMNGMLVICFGEGVRFSDVVL